MKKLLHELGFGGRLAAVCAFAAIAAGSASAGTIAFAQYDEASSGNQWTTGAQFSSRMGGSGGSFDARATAGNLNQLVRTPALVSLSHRPSAASGTGTFSSSRGSTVPWPETLCLIGAGLVGIGMLRRRKRFGPV
jgi:hypothetical protein